MEVMGTSGSPRFCRHGTPLTQDCEQCRSEIPRADPSSPEVRLLRAIFGLCTYCDVTEPHAHGSWINGQWWPLEHWHERPPGPVEDIEEFCRE